MLSPALALVAMAVATAPRVGSGTLPICSNKVVVEVVKRAGCTLGDVRCWNRKGGFCNDYVDARVRKERGATATELSPVPAERVAVGDVAVFLSRAHYAYVEAVVKDRSGRVVAVDVAEYNYGTCWVDRNAMVTEKYGVLNRRAAVPVLAVDGGFLRTRPVAP